VYSSRTSVSRHNRVFFFVIATTAVYSFIISIARTTVYSFSLIATTTVHYSAQVARGGVSLEEVAVDYTGKGNADLKQALKERGLQVRHHILVY
jgi:hypothetical protein